MDKSKITLLEELKYRLGFSEMFLESIEDGLLVIDTEAAIIMLNGAFCRMTGFSKQELLGVKAPYPFWPPEKLEEFAEGFKKTLNEDFKGEYETVHVRKNGERFPIVVFTSSIKDHNGKIVAHMALFQDLSVPGLNLQEEKENNQELFSMLGFRKKYLDLLSEKKFLAQLDYTLNNIEDGIISLDNDWRYTFVNKKAEQIIHRKLEDLLGKVIWNEFPDTIGLNFHRSSLKAKQTNEKQIFEEYYPPLDIWFELRMYPSQEGLTIFFSDISDRKSSAALIEHKDQIFNLINESMTQPLFILEVEPGPRFRFISVSKSFLKTLDITEEEVVQKQVGEVIPEPSLTLVIKKYKKAIADKKPVQWEETTPFKTGLKTAIVTVSPLINSHGDCTHLVGIVHDITERKQAEQLLVQNEKYLENIIDNIGDPIFVKDDQSRILLVNNAFCSLFDLAKKDIIGKSLAEDVAPDERDSFLKIDREVIETGQENINEEALTVRGGETRIISTKKTRFVDEMGNRYLIGIIRDITDRKKNELALKAAKEYSESLVDAMHEGLVVFNSRTAIISVNPSFCKISGFAKEELLGKECPYPFSPPEIAEESEYRHQEIAKGADLENFETVYMRKDGTRFNVDVRISSLKDQDGKITSYFATVIDTTVRKKAELELKLAKEFTDKLIMSMQEGLIIVDLTGKIIQVNDSTCNILGYSKEELEGMTLPYPFAKTEDLQAISTTNSLVAQGKAPAFQFEFIRKNGEMFTATFLTGNITNDEGEVIALFGTMKDVSEEERVKQLLERNARKAKKKKEVILELANLVGTNIDSSFDKITELASEALEVERVSVWSFNPDKSQILCENLYTQSNRAHTNGVVLTKAENPKYFETLEKSRAIMIDNVLIDPITKQSFQSYLKPNNIISLMDVFINSTNGSYGIISFEHTGEVPHHWTPDELQFASSIANVVSLMIESNERKIAENKLIVSNKELAKANEELNLLRNKLEQENIYLRNELDLVFNFEEMVYGSVEFSNVLSEVEKVAPTNATVLLLGESGTGKELLARAVHNISLRNNKPLIKVNCSAIPRELMESELFGHRKGSFTGATSDKVGKFELAQHGTLFLDEIGELPLEMQPKILRFLQEGEIEVVGGTEIKKLDVRIIAATNRNLKEEIEKKNFREDLYFRLNVFPIEVPPLRKRKADIPLLVEHFVDKFNKEYNKSIKYISDAAMKKLKAYHWPGNIRELENLIERASIVSTSDTLIIPGFESSEQQAKMALTNKDLSLDAIQRNHIISVLEKCDWKMSGANSASEILGLKPSTLRDKMAKLGIKK